MKRILPLVTVIFLVACGGAATPSQSSVQTAIAQTQQAMPTATALPAPTSTVPPTPTSVPTPIPTPIPTVKALPDLFKTQVQQTLDEGSKLVAMTDAGLTYKQLGDQLVIVQAKYNLLASSWPEYVTVNTSASFLNAFKGWQLALKMWEIKNTVGSANADAFRNTYGYKIYTEFYAGYLSYMGGKAITATDDNNNWYMPFDENIRALLGLAAGNFNDARDQLMLVLK
jgi:hypothetical protein